MSTRFLPFILILIAAVSSAQSSDSLMRTIHNTGEGRWDAGGDTTLVFEEDLVIGVEDGDEDYVLGRVFDVAIGGDGAIYVLDNGFNRVQKYDSTGVFITSFGAKGEGPGMFMFPVSMDVDGGTVYVADRSRIQLFSTMGQYEDGFAHGFPQSSPGRIRVAGAQGIYFACYDRDAHKDVHHYDRAHKKVGSFSTSYSAAHKVDPRAELMWCGGSIDVGSDGRVYYAQRIPYTVRAFSPDGDPIWEMVREADFIQDPIGEELDGGGYRVGLPTSSASILVLDDGRLMNVLFNYRDDENREFIVDLFDSDGVLLTSVVSTDLSIFRTRDARGRVYGITREPFPRVVRYWVRYAAATEGR
jgi:hypothetical protein